MAKRAGKLRIFKYGCLGASHVQAASCRGRIEGSVAVPEANTPYAAYTAGNTHLLIAVL